MCLVEECGKTYSRMDNLNIYLLAVHGIDERNRKHRFCCPLYEEKFYRATLLTTHMSEVHKAVVGKSTKVYNRVA